MTYETFLRTVGGNIKQIRNQAGLTLNKAAQASYVRWTQLRDIENGKANPTLKTLNKIAIALKVDIDEFCKLDGKKKVERVRFKK